MKITERLKNYIDFDNHKYKLRLSFDRVLTAMESFENPALTDEIKINVFCSLIIKQAPFEYEKRVQIVDEIVKNYIAKEKQSKNNEPSFDFSQDADYIFAAFWQTYRIDLIKQRGKLDWRKFYALFLGLPDNTRLSEIMSIRTRKEPAPNDYNQEEIKLLREAKQYYALERKEKSGKFDAEITEYVSKMFDYYRSKAGIT